MNDPYSTWYLGVMHGLGAPANAITADVAWAWSGAESGTDRMRINNPLNTTQPEGAGNVDFNSVGVKEYPTVAQGIAATVTTLLNGYYPTIVSHLRNSVPRQQWGDACHELGVWGTGCSWIGRDYGLAPHIAGDDMNLTDVKGVLIAAAHGVGRGLNPPLPGGHTVIQADVDASADRYIKGEAALDVLVAEIVSTPDAQAYENAVKALIAAGGTPGPQGPPGPTGQMGATGPSGPQGPPPDAQSIHNAIVAFFRSLLGL